MSKPCSSAGCCVENAVARFYDSFENVKVGDWVDRDTSIIAIEIDGEQLECKLHLQHPGIIVCPKCRKLQPSELLTEQQRLTLYASGHMSPQGEYLSTPLEIEADRALQSRYAVMRRFGHMDRFGDLCTSPEEIAESVNWLRRQECWNGCPCGTRWIEIHGGMLSDEVLQKMGIQKGILIHELRTDNRFVWFESRLGEIEGDLVMEREPGEEWLYCFYSNHSLELLNGDSAFPHTAS